MEHESKKVRIINSLCLLTATLAFIIGNIFFLTTSRLAIELPAMLEGLSFTAIILLNKFRRYKAASVGILIVHCVFACYFGIQLGETINLLLIAVFLLSATFLIYSEWWLRVISITVTLATILVLEFNFYYQWVTPITMSRENQFIIRWTAIAAFLSFDLIVILYYVNEVARLIKQLKAYVYMISHEFRNNVYLLSLIVSNMSKDIKDNEQLKSIEPYIKDINQIVTSIKSAFNNILPYGQIESGKEKPPVRSTFRIREHINSIVNPYLDVAKKRGIAIQILPNKEMPDVLEGYPEIIDLCLSNLVGNAIKYADSFTTIYVIISPNGKTWKIDVANQCLDINPKKQAALFNMFETNRRNASIEGTGIGLYTVEQKVKTVNGSLVLDSKDKTTTFSLIFPLEIGKSEDIKPEETTDQEPDLHGLHFIIADDDLMVPEYLGRLLAKMGATYSIVQDGFGVLEQLEKMIPDMIILDVNMPNLDGKQTLIHLENNQRYKKIPVMIATAAECSPTELNEFYALGAKEILYKLDNKSLMPALKRQLIAREQSLQEINV